MTQELMIEFARHTGLSPAAETPRRYLWTDAFATCNYLGLYCRSGDQKYRDLALDLVDQVHHTRLQGPVEALMGYQPLVEEIETFWLDPVNQEAETWKEHRDINTVMLATSLAPDGFLSV